MLGRARPLQGSGRDATVELVVTDGLNAQVPLDLGYNVGLAAKQPTPAPGR